LITCECAKEVNEKYKFHSAYYTFKICRTPDEAQMKRIDWDSWWRGYLQAHADIHNFLTFIKRYPEENL
jgi:succinate dehydrogenase flavin-adding protein (antitoxin of CptAB toxin-antitoxin module)